MEVGLPSSPEKFWAIGAGEKGTFRYFIRVVFMIIICIWDSKEIYHVHCICSNIKSFLKITFFFAFCTLSVERDNEINEIRENYQDVFAVVSPYVSSMPWPPTLWWPRESRTFWQQFRVVDIVGGIGYRVRKGSWFVPSLLPLARWQNSWQNIRLNLSPKMQ